MRGARPIRSLGLVVLICALSLLSEVFGLFAGVNRSIGDLRMAASPREASGQVVFVAVDAQSLTGIGSWPWSRAVHATLLNRLGESGALDVLFDFDFTFPGDATGDRAFEDALERSSAATYLAVFQQPSTSVAGSDLHLNRPTARLAERSWPALVNVLADANGIVRGYPYGADIEGGFIASAAFLLAGHTDADAASFDINFSLRPDTVPVVSALDVLNNATPQGIFAGRSVIVGASAIELSDQLSVPVHGIVPGPLIHALAAETLMQDLVPNPVRPEVVALILLCLLGLLQSVLHRIPWLALAVTGAGLVGVEIGALALFRTANLHLPTAMLYPSLVAFGLWQLAHGLRKHQWLLLKADFKARNTVTMLERVFHDSSDGIVVLEQDGTILRHSASADAIFGVDETGRLNLPKRLARCGETAGQGTSPVRKIEIERGGKPMQLEYEATGSELELPLGFGKAKTVKKITTLVVRDITKLVEQEQDIAYLSNYDERTGALRRNAFLAFLGLRLEDGRDAAVFALSLPRFKTINVTLGRNVGDALLKEVVARLERSPMQLSSVARLGGTRFAFYTEGCVDPEAARALAEVVLKDLARPYELAEANAQVGVLIGYVTIPGGCDPPPETALEQAEEALDSAKKSGTSLELYDHTAWEKQRRARDVERAMVDALANDEFFLLYQPQHNVADGRLVGAEALIRWQSPKLGIVYPDEFIGIAESTGFIVELGLWTLERAAKDALTLSDDVTIAVNVSGIQITHSDFAHDVEQVLGRVGLPPNRICLELTETVLLASTQSIIETMQDLSFLGLSWALDDFGTGFSSMEYLSKMPLDKIKLDKSFTMQLGLDPAARPILHSTGELCRGLDVKLLCEGVETPGQLAVLDEESCTEAQGYLFGRPMPLDQLAQKIAESKAPGPSVTERIRSRRI